MQGPISQWFGPYTYCDKEIERTKAIAYLKMLRTARHAISSLGLEGKVKVYNSGLQGSAISWVAMRQNMLKCIGKSRKVSDACRREAEDDFRLVFNKPYDHEVAIEKRMLGNQFTLVQHQFNKQHIRRAYYLLEKKLPLDNSGRMFSMFDKDMTDGINIHDYLSPLGAIHNIQYLKSLGAEHIITNEMGVFLSRLDHDASNKSAVGKLANQWLVWKGVSFLSLGVDTIILFSESGKGKDVLSTLTKGNTMLDSARLLMNEFNGRRLELYQVSEREVRSDLKFKVYSFFGNENTRINAYFAMVEPEDLDVIRSPQVTGFIKSLHETGCRLLDVTGRLVPRDLRIDDPGRYSGVISICERGSST
jgi:hypothetical protein